MARSLRNGAMLTAVLVVVTIASLNPAVSDVVTKKNGASVEGKVVSVDHEWVVVQVSRNRVRISRDDVDSIRFSSESSPPPLKVEIRNVISDDAIDILLDGEVVLERGRRGGSWIDLTPKLKNGNNSLRFRIHNDKGMWGYQVSVRINGKVTELQCGTPPRADSPCECCGNNGFETGVIDNLPVMWIHVDRALGQAEVIQ